MTGIKNKTTNDKKRNEKELKAKNMIFVTIDPKKI
jgi:hypothetical protein